MIHYKFIFKLWYSVSALNLVKLSTQNINTTAYNFNESSNPSKVRWKLLTKGVKSRSYKVVRDLSPVSIKTTRCERDFKFFETFQTQTASLKKEQICLVVKFLGQISISVLAANYRILVYFNCDSFTNNHKTAILSMRI